MYRAARGTADILPQDQPWWRHVEAKAVDICQLYGYRRIDTPVFEDAGLFVRSIGKGTDIVEKEMYSFEDRSGDLLTLRPEGTAPVCRAYLEHGMHNLPQPVRLFYFAPIFRYERPQAGRYRQHWQFGCEALGDADPALDAEIMHMAWTIYSNVGLRDLVLRLNSIGCRQCRPQYLERLRGYYAPLVDLGCPDCRRRFDKNTLRLLDCKHETCSRLAEDAPMIIEYLCVECREHFDSVKAHLAVLGLDFTLDHRLVRGLDYYSRTVFEIQPPGQTASQSTIGGGGRYDGLMEELGGRPTAAVGFATGIERIILNLQRQGVLEPGRRLPAAFVAYLGNEARQRALEYASQIRREGAEAIVASGGRSLKSQLRQANALEAQYTIILGEDELKDGVVVLRDMNRGDQQRVSLADALVILRGGV